MQERPAWPISGGSGRSDGSALGLLDQAVDGRRHLGADTGPVLDAVEGDFQVKARNINELIRFDGSTWQY